MIFEEISDLSLLGCCSIIACSDGYLSQKNPEFVAPLPIKGLTAWMTKDRTWKNGMGSKHKGERERGGLTSDPWGGQTRRFYKISFSLYSTLYSCITYLSIMMIYLKQGLMLDIISSRKNASMWVSCCWWELREWTKYFESLTLKIFLCSMSQ